MSNYYYCIDVGGTDIKAGIVDESYNILCTTKTPTNIYFKSKSLADTLIQIIKELEKESGLDFQKAKGLGIGLPGLVDDNAGIVKFINCLELSNYNIRKEFEAFSKVPIHLANDAECATMAEYKIGAGQGYKNIAMLTLGTGIGSGLIINGTPLRSYMPFACELGHIKITASDDESFEKLASTKALVNQTRQAMEFNLNSKMWTKYNLETVCGKTVFEFKDSDETAAAVFKNYISHLGTGITNIYNIFTPEIIIIGGGVSKQGKALIDPLTEYINERIFTRNINNKVKIVPAKHLNDAGILGARCLFN